MCRDCTMWASGGDYGTCRHPAMQIQFVPPTDRYQAPPPKEPLTAWDYGCRYDTSSPVHSKVSEKSDEAEAERRKQIVSRLVIRETERNIAAQFEGRYGSKPGTKGIDDERE